MDEVELLCKPCTPQDPGERLLSAFERRDYRVFKACLSDVPLDHPNCVACLNKATADPSTVDYVKLLLSVGVDPNQADGKKKRTPLQVAAEANNVEALRILLRDKRIRVGVLDQFGDTVLHLLTKGKGQSEVQAQCVDILLGHQQVDFVNKKNRKGHSAILLAANKCSVKVVEAFLKHPGIDLDHAKFLNGDTARHLISKNFPGMASNLPPPITDKKVDDDALMTMLYYGNDQITQFCTAVREGKCKNLNHHDGKQTFLQRACISGLYEVAQVLLENGADPEATCPNNVTPPVMMASSGGYADILQLLNKYDTKTKLFRARTRDGDTALIQLIRSWDGSSSYEHCLKLLLDVDATSGVDLNAANEDGNTALHYAAITGDRQLMLALLKHGAYIGGANKQERLPITNIPRDILEAHFDDCLAAHQSAFSEDYEIEFDYSCLVPPGKRESDRLLSAKAAEDCEFGDVPLTPEPIFYSESAPLLYMSRHPDLRPLLKHPLLTSFLEKKWRQLSIIFAWNMVFYVTFVAILTIHILWGNGRNHSDDSHNATIKATPPVASESSNPGYTCKLWVQAVSESNDETKSPITNSDSSEYWATTYDIVQWIGIVLWVLLLLRELFQFFVSPKRYFSWSKRDNYFEILVLTSCAVVLFQTGDGTPLTRSFAAVAILLSWGELVLQIGRYPTLSTYIEMLKRVSLNFLKFLAWYSLLIIAFALSFYTLFRDNDGQDNFFADPGMSVFKTMVMMTGEFDVSDIPFVEFPVLSHMVFVMFVFLIAIVLFNLLNGLAVSDTQAIKDDAELVGYVSRVRLVAYIERMVLGHTKHHHCHCWYSFLRFRPLVRHVTLFSESAGYVGHVTPNQGCAFWVAPRNADPNKEPATANCHLDGDIVKAAEVVIAMKDRPSDIEQIRRALEANQERLASVEVHCMEMERMVKEILHFVREKQSV